MFMMNLLKTLKSLFTRKPKGRIKDVTDDRRVAFIVPLDKEEVKH